MSNARWLSAWLIACVSAWNLSASFAEEKIVWAESFTAARNQAEYERRLILLHFYSDNCPPCDKVEHEVFPDKAVQEAIGRNYVALKVHVKKSPGLADKYEIHQWPVDVIVSPSGQQISRSVSPQAPDKYCAMLNNIALQAGVGAGRTAASSPSATEANTGLPPMGASRAGWNDGQQPQNYNAAPPQGQGQTNQAPQNQVPQGQMQTNPWVNQATQATQSAGESAQRWGNYIQNQSQQASQYMQQATAPAQPGAAQNAVNQQVQQYQNAAQQTYQQYHDATKQTAGRYREAAQQTANNFQQQGQQTAAHWQEQAGQVQQRANQYQAAAGQAVDDYTASAGRAYNGFRETAAQTAQETTAAANQTVDTVRRSAGQVADNIANATTMPSQLPPRRNSYGGGEFVTDVAPQPGRAQGGTSDVPRTETIRTGEATMPPGPSDRRYQMRPGFEQGDQPYGNSPPQPAVRVNGSQDVRSSNPSAGRTNVTPGPYSNYPGNAPTVVPGALPPNAGPANTPWNVPPANRSTDTARSRGGFAGDVPEWQPGSAAPPAEKPTWNNDPNPTTVARTPSGSATNERRTNDGPPVAPQVVENIPPRASASATNTNSHSGNPPASASANTSGSAQPPLAMDGFCPVTMTESKKWIKGDSRYGVNHREQIYLFASAAAQQNFLANADRYAPVLGGHDPVRFAEGGQLVPGKREHGIMFNNQIYLFSSEESLREFSKARDRYVDVVNQTNQAMAEADRNMQRR